MKKYFFLVLLEVILFNNYLRAQWVQTNGPYGGAFTSIAVSGNKVVADISFISTDAGKNWESINTGKSLNSVRALLVSGDTILAGINYGGLYISTDNGNNWIHNSNGIKTDADVMALTYAGGSNIFAGTDSGLFKSSNNGTSWLKTNNGLNNVAVTSIAVKGNKIVLATRDGIFLSLDFGSSWKLVNSELHDPYSLGKVAFNGDTVFFAINYRGAFVSIDNGSTWKESNQGLDYKTFIYCLKSDGHSVFLGSSDSGFGSGLFQSTDNGSSWHFVNNGFPAQTRVWDIAASGFGIFAATEGAGILLSTNGGSIWNVSNNGITGLNLACLAAKGDSLFAGSSYGGIHLSTDNGLNFKDIYNHYFDDIYVNAFAFDSKNIYAATSGNSVILSTDNGMTWNGKGHASVSSLILYKEMLFMTRDADPGHFGGLYYTTDQGNNWTKITGLPGIQDAHSVTSNGKTIFVIVLGKIYLSADDGLNWKLSDKGLEGKTINLLKAKNNVVFAAADSGKLYRTVNDGADWKLSNNGLPEDKFTSFAFSGDSIVLAGTDSCGVYLSIDNGLSWKSVNSNLPVKSIKDLLIKENLVFVAAKSTIWRRMLSDLITPTFAEPLNETSRIPDVYRLEQNYPNPFNPITAIKYSLPQKSHVKLQISDMLGREVIILVNKEQDAGEYNIQFDASSLPSGIYIYSLQTGAFRAARKCIMIK
ncbi:MAG: T9SS type A sorting domain-containing protein [Methanococcaceae archaeon]